MTTANFTINNYERALINPSYLKELLENNWITGGLEKKDYPLAQTIDINSVNMSLASGYGSWRVTVNLTIDGIEKSYSSRHHNEEWYLSSKTIYNNIADSEEEMDEAKAAFQAAFESVVDYNQDDIMCVISDNVEDEQE